MTEFGTLTVQLSNPWARISEIAKRLGVEPTVDGDPPGVVAKGADGKYYDLFKIVIALLDRMNEVMP